MNIYPSPFRIREGFNLGDSVVDSKLFSSVLDLDPVLSGFWIRIRTWVPFD
jgi:hypothetical protein